MFTLFAILQAVTTTITLDFGIIVAAMAHVVTTITVWLLQKKTVQHNRAESIARRDANQGVLIANQEDIRSMVNGRLDAALEVVKALETEIRRLNAKGSAPTTEDTTPVSMSPKGTVTTKPHG